MNVEKKVRDGSVANSVIVSIFLLKTSTDKGGVYLVFGCFSCCVLCAQICS